MFNYTLPALNKKTPALIPIELSPFIPPSKLPNPTVDSQTRCQLEQLMRFNIRRPNLALSRKAGSLLVNTIRSIVTERIFLMSFYFSKLDGFCASKSGISNNPERAYQPNMAAMGKIVTDLRDLKDKNGEDKINACINWKESDLTKKIKLFTDSWHKRYYWDNNGGSHHTAVLCYELQNQKKEWTPEVEVTEYSLNLSTLEAIETDISLFVVMADSRSQNYYIDNTEPLNLFRSTATSDLTKQLGATRFRPWSSLYLKQYNLVVIDHSKVLSSLVIDHMNNQSHLGYAMPFKLFLNDFLNS